MQPERPLDEPGLTRDEKELERSLGGLSPIAPAFDAHQLWARDAARREARRVWYWRGVSGALAACLVLALWARRPATPPQPQIVYVHDQAGEAAQQSPPMLVWMGEPASERLSGNDSDDNYLSVRLRVLRGGINSLDLPHVSIGRSSESTAPTVRPDLQADRPAKRAPAGPFDRFFNLIDKGTQL